MSRWSKYCDEVIYNMEDILKKLGKGKKWIDSLKKIAEKEAKGGLVIYLKEFVEDIKELRGSNDFAEKRYDKLNRTLVPKMMFLHYQIAKNVDFKEFQKRKENILEKIIVAKENLFFLRDLTEEDMGKGK